MRRDALLALAGLVMLAYAGADAFRSQPRTFEYQMDACHTPVTVMEPLQEPPVANAIVIHGLAANRHIMTYTARWLSAQGLRVYALDLPGHGDSTEHFTYANAESCAGQAIDELAERGDIRVDRTILLGHSMGGEIAIRLADRFPNTAATIAISPAPLVAPLRMPANLMVASAQFDIPWLRATARQLASDAGGTRISPDDFAQRRAFKLLDLSFSDHVSLLFDARAGEKYAAWTRQALGIPGPPEPVPGSPRLALLLGCAGIVLLFPLAATLIAGPGRRGAQHFPDRDPEAKFGAQVPDDAAPSALAPRTALLYCGVAAVLAVAFLAAVPHYEWLGLSNGSYLTTCLLISGMALAALVVRRDTNWGWSVRGVFSAIALAFIFAMASRAWLGGADGNAAGWSLSRAGLDSAMQGLLLTSPRWLRLGPAALAVFPYCLAEEIALGPRLPGMNWRRFGLFVAMRFELWLPMAAAILITMNSQVLIAVLLPGFIGASVAQHYGSEAVRRRTGSPAAAAIFGAIIAAWFIVSVFPLT